MKFMCLAIALLAAFAHADEINDERQRNDLLLEARRDRLNQIPRGHYVVVAGGEFFESGKELAPLLAMVEAAQAGAKHRYVFRRGDEGMRKASVRSSQDHILAGRQFFRQSGIRLSHDERQWIVDRADGVVVGTSVPKPTLVIDIGGRRRVCRLEPAADIPLVSGDRRERHPRFEIPGIASTVERSGMDFGYRRYFIEVKFKNVETPIRLELWGAADRLSNILRKLPNRNVKGNPWTLQKKWSADALQVRDPDLRERTLETLRAELGGDDATRIQAALGTLAQLGVLKYDKQSFRPLVLPHFNSKISSVRTAAGYALYNTSREDDDLKLILAMAKDESTNPNRSMAHLIFMFSDGEVTGEAGEAVLGLMQRGQGRVARDVVGGVWGAHVTPEIEAEVLKMAQDPAQRSDAIYFGLSTWRQKSRKVCDVLLEAATDPDGNINQRAMWGLGHGVRPDDYNHVAYGVLKLMESRDSPRIQLQCLRMLRTYAGPDQLSQLEKFAANKMLADNVRAAAEGVIELIRTGER